MLRQPSNMRAAKLTLSLMLQQPTPVSCQFFRAARAASTSTKVSNLNTVSSHKKAYIEHTEDA